MGSGGGKTIVALAAIALSIPLYGISLGWWLSMLEGSRTLSIPLYGIIPLSKKHGATRKERLSIPLYGISYYIL